MSEDYKLIFRGDSKVTVKKRISAINSLTFCLWIKRYGDTEGRLISLMNDNSEPSVSFFLGDKHMIRINRVNYEGQITIPRATWHHLCLVFNIREPSEVRVYIDGSRSEEITVSNFVSHLASGKQLVLGDIQRAGESGFKGEIAHFNAWKKVLSESDLNTVRSSCLFPSNNVDEFNDNLLFKWSVDQTDIDIHGSASKIKSDACGKYLYTTLRFRLPILLNSQDSLH